MLTPKRPDTDLDKFHEECALFGIYGTSDAAAHTALGLHALQHRGQEASGIVTFDGRHFHDHRASGLVGDIFGADTAFTASSLVGGAEHLVVDGAVGLADGVGEAWDAVANW